VLLFFSEIETHQKARDGYEARIAELESGDKPESQLESAATARIAELESQLESAAAR
jgi:hypothetical protein